MLQQGREASLGVFAAVFKRHVRQGLGPWGVRELALDQMMSEEEEDDSGIIIVSYYYYD